MSDTNDAGRAPTEEELARAFQDLKNVHAIDVVNELLVSLYSFASTKLGLSDATAELRDLGDAHFAIEAFGALLKVVDREFGEVQTQALRDTLAQLQLGYVQALDLPGERPTEPAEAEPAGEPAGAESGGERSPRRRRPCRTPKGRCRRAKRHRRRTRSRRARRQRPRWRPRCRSLRGPPPGNRRPRRLRRRSLPPRSLPPRSLPPASLRRRSRRSRSHRRTRPAEPAHGPQGSPASPGEPPHAVGVPSPGPADPLTSPYSSGRRSTK